MSSHVPPIARALLQVTERALGLLGSRAFALEVAVLQVCSERASSEAPSSERGVLIRGRLRFEDSSIRFAVRYQRRSRERVIDVIVPSRLCNESFQSLEAYAAGLASSLGLGILEAKLAAVLLRVARARFEERSAVLDAIVRDVREPFGAVLVSGDRSSRAPLRALGVPVEVRSSFRASRKIEGLLARLLWPLARFLRSLRIMPLYENDRYVGWSAVGLFVVAPVTSSDVGPVHTVFRLQVAAGRGARRNTLRVVTRASYSPRPRVFDMEASSRTEMQLLFVPHLAFQLTLHVLDASLRRMFPNSEVASRDSVLREVMELAIRLLKEGGLGIASEVPVAVLRRKAWRQLFEDPWASFNAGEVGD